MRDGPLVGESPEPAAMVVLTSRFDNIAGLYRRRADGDEQSDDLKCAAGQYYHLVHLPSMHC